MKLIIGLGNPGKDYSETWHNLGFMAIDKFRELNDFNKFKKDAKLLSEISSGKIGREKIILAKPQTFMNNSGQGVSTISHYFHIPPEGIIVIHDDVDLPLGKIRISFDSSAGGHNGIKSIIESLGTKKFTRVRIGIKTDKLEKVGMADYVLESIPADKKKVIPDIMDSATSACLEIISNSTQAAMNNFN